MDKKLDSCLGRRRGGMTGILKGRRHAGKTGRRTGRWKG
jgi:hypothetical protein